MSHLLQLLGHALIYTLLLWLRDFIVFETLLEQGPGLLSVDARLGQLSDEGSRDLVDEFVLVGAQLIISAYFRLLWSFDGL